MTAKADPDPPGYDIRESKRARQVILKMNRRRELVVVVPVGFDRRQIPGIVARKQAWIEKTRQRMAVRAAPDGPSRPERIDLQAVERVYRVDWDHRPGGPVVLSNPGEDRLLISGDCTDARAYRRVLLLWLRRQGRRHLSQWLAEESARTGLGYQSVQIRAQKSRWGSCSKRGTISLNCKMLFFPAELVRYVMVHELSHTRYLNHSERFWSLVGEIEPEYRRLDGALKAAWGFVPEWAD